MNEAIGLIVLLMGLKAAGLALVLYNMWLGHRGQWLHYIMCYFGISGGLFIYFGWLLSVNHFDPGITAIDIVIVCWLWHRSRQGVRNERY